MPYMNGGIRMRAQRFSLLIVAALTVSGCFNPTVRPPPSTAMPQLPIQDEGYGLQPGDVIQISVWREPELDQVVLVRPDGGISLPLVGEVYAEGRTTEEVSLAIAEALSVFIPAPEVTVSLQQSEGNRIYVTGRVNSPGMFLVNRPVTIMQALSLAGGLTPFADKDSIIVLRKEDGAQRSIPFNYKEVQRGESLGQNISLRSGDTLIVP